MMVVVAAAVARVQVVAAWCCLPTTNPSCVGRTWTPTAQHSFVARRLVAPLSASSLTETTTNLDLSSSSSSSSSDAAAASSLLADPTAASSDAVPSPSEHQLPLEPKQIVKLFGRLADKYLLLDPSGGNCCFSGCTGCEYRLEGGGYKMADSTSSRPKWIPTYATRINAAGLEVTSKWSQQLFGESTSAIEDGTTSNEGDAAAAATTKTKSIELDYETFRSRIVQMEYEPPLGGPNLPKSAAASVDDDLAIRRLWTILLGKKKKKEKKKDNDGDQTLKLRKVQKQWQRIAASSSEGSSSSSDDNNNAGITWKQFLAAMQSNDL